MTVPAHPLPTTRLVDADGPVCVADYGGARDGPLLVAVHGLGGSHLNWMAVAPALTRRSRLLAVDLVGHGHTPAAGRSADVAGHRRLLSGVLRTVADEPAVVVGNSMGGTVAALQAAEEPGTVAGLVLVDPALPVSGLPGPVHPRVLGNFLVCALPALGERFLDARRRLTTARQVVNRALRVCCADPSRVPADVVDALVDLTAGVDRRRADAAYLQSARSLTALMVRPAPVIRRLQRLDHPVLLIHGERDLLVPISVARRLHALHPEWRLAVAAGVGHVPMLEAPAWTAGVIDGWLGSSPLGATSFRSGASTA